MSLPSTIYNALFRRTSTFAMTIVATAFVFERGFDMGIDYLWRTNNKGVRWTNTNKFSCFVIRLYIVGYHEARADSHQLGLQARPYIIYRLFLIINFAISSQPSSVNPRLGLLGLSEAWLDPLAATPFRASCVEKCLGRSVENTLLRLERQLKFRDQFSRWAWLCGGLLQ